MSGDHRDTTKYKTELFTEAGFKQVRNTSLFSKNSKLILTPGVAENKQGKHWFDVREAIITNFTPSVHSTFFVIIRIVTGKFIVLEYSRLSRILTKTSKIEKSGSKVWSFEIESDFTLIVNKVSRQDKLAVTVVNEHGLKEIINKL